MMILNLHFGVKKCENKNYFNTTFWNAQGGKDLPISD